MEASTEPSRLQLAAASTPPSHPLKRVPRFSLSGVEGAISVDTTRCQYMPEPHCHLLTSELTTRLQTEGLSLTCSSKNMCLSSSVSLLSPYVLCKSVRLSARVAVCIGFIPLTAITCRAPRGTRQRRSILALAASKSEPETPRRTLPWHIRTSTQSHKKGFAKQVWFWVRFGLTSAKTV